MASYSAVQLAGLRAAMMVDKWETWARSWAAMMVRQRALKRVDQRVSYSAAK